MCRVQVHESWGTYNWVMAHMNESWSVAVTQMHDQVFAL